MINHVHSWIWNSDSALLMKFIIIFYPPFCLEIVARKYGYSFQRIFKLLALEVRGVKYELFIPVDCVGISFFFYIADRLFERKEEKG